MGNPNATSGGWGEHGDASRGAPDHSEYTNTSEDAKTTTEIPVGYHEISVTDGTTTWTDHPRGGDAMPYNSIPRQD